MNAVIYARYSSDNQREESIEGQLRECKEYADQNGITVVRTYIDRALSAKTDSRPQFQQMIHDSATHTFEAVLVWKLDRFSRNRYDSAHYKRILKNRRYLGEYCYKDTVIPDAIPAIIDPDCFDAVQRRCEIHRQAPAHNKTDVHYLLTTKLFCGKCGTMMAGESGRSHTGTVHCYYKCGTRKRSGKEACSLKPVRKEPLEQFVVQTALEKVLNDRVIDLLADKLLEYQSKENTRLPVLQAELKEVKRRIDNLVAAIEQGILTPSTKTRMEELEQQREALETSILQEQIEKPLITREQILFWFDQFRHGDPADIAFQEKVIDCFVNSIYLFDDRIVVNFNYQEGGRSVSLEEVLSSFLDGNGAPKKSLTGT